MSFFYKVLRAKLVACTAFAASAIGMAQQAPEPPGPTAIAALVTDAVQAQQEDMRHLGWAMRYRVHRVDGKENSVRDLVETTDGHVARTVQRNGHPLTPEEHAAEAQRLQALAKTGKRHHGADPFDRYSKELIAAMPTAMEYTWVPGQPQLPQFTQEQAVLDFRPRTAFQPASATQSLLKGLAGRIWIDKETHHLLRIEINILQDLDVAMGLLARVYKGGRLVYEQVPAGGNHDAYRYIEVDVRLRELMVRNVPYHLTLETSDRNVLPTVPSLKEGIAMLLAE